MNLFKNSIHHHILKIWEEEPLKVILFLAIFFRLCAVFFAKGWGMLDDHFLIIETSQSWVDGRDVDDWLPSSPDNFGPTGHNFFYPGFHFLLFSLTKFLHLSDPQVKMTIVRFLHACWSLITVYFGYKITRVLGGDRAARLAGLLLAIMWFMPWGSVRNLVEVVCIPFLILATWRLVRKPLQLLSLTDLFIAGIFLGFAFNIRFQTAWFSIGVGACFLYYRKWKEVVILTLGAILPFIIIQGTIDFFIWGKPFAETLGYINGNIIDARSYINQPWYNYFIVVLGFMLPPVSLFLLFGFVKSWKKYLIIFLPVTLFFVFHSSFPNKQERFILPILPFVMILGSIGWIELISKRESISKSKWIKGSWIFFWVVNTILLLGVSFMYSKRARVETMYYLSKYKSIEYILVNDAANSPELFPLFYLGQWPYMYDRLNKEMNTDEYLIRVSKLPPELQPRFILFSTEKDLRNEVLKARKLFPFIVYETTIEPGYIDKFVRWLNPVNKNRKVYIYRNTLFYPRKIE